MGPTWVLTAPDGPHVGPMNLAIRGVYNLLPCIIFQTFKIMQGPCRYGRVFLSEMQQCKRNNLLIILKYVSIINQIQRNFCFAFILILMKWSLQHFAQERKAVVACAKICSDLIYGPITIGSHKCTKICWLAESKTGAIASVLTPLINKFECICEGDAWWVCII